MKIILSKSKKNVSSEQNSKISIFKFLNFVTILRTACKKALDFRTFRTTLELLEPYYLN